MRRSILLGPIVTAMALSAHAQPASAPDAAGPSAEAIEKADASFTQAFGDQVRRVTATADKADDVAFAAQMLEAAGGAVESPELVVVMLRQAAELASVDAGGYEIAVTAYTKLLEAHPRGAGAYLSSLVTVRQRQYLRARGGEKDAAATAYLDVLLEAAAAEVEAAEWDRAIGLYRQALAIVGRVDPDRRSEILDGLNDARARQRLAVRAAQLKRKLAEARKADPDAAATAAGDLLKLLIVEMDDPAEARKYTFLSDDATLKANTRMAARPVESLDEAEAEALGKWYRSMVAEAPTESKGAMLERARLAYERYLQLHGEEDLKGHAVRKSVLKGIETELEKLAAASPAGLRARTAARVDWAKDRSKVTYRWLEQNMGRGQYDYRDPDHRLLTDGVFKPRYHDDSVVWGAPSKPSPLVFDFGRRVRPRQVRFYFHGTDAPGGGMAQPSSVRVYNGSRDKPGRLLARVDPVPDRTGWLEVPLPQTPSSVSRYYWIEIGASKGTWTLVEEVEFH
ncbi:MAG: hypothetical protein OER86_10650 [Phycisphaerae bacterium]|nr:hypothetical protein [Phycisphaerae bacterium]